MTDINKSTTPLDTPILIASWAESLSRQSNAQILAAFEVDEGNGENPYAGEEEDEIED